MKIQIIEDYEGELLEKAECISHELEKSVKIARLKDSKGRDRYKHKALHDMHIKGSSEYERIMDKMVDRIHKVMLRQPGER